MFYYLTNRATQPSLRQRNKNKEKARLFKCLSDVGDWQRFCVATSVKGKLRTDGHNLLLMENLAHKKKLNIFLSRGIMIDVMQIK